MITWGEDRKSGSNTFCHHQQIYSTSELTELAKLTSRLKRLGQFISAGIVALYFYFSDSLYEWYKELPPTLTWSGVVIVSVVLGAMILADRRWPSEFLPYHNGIKSFLKRLFDSLWVFIMGGLFKVFYPLTMSLLPFYRSPGFWIFLLLEALLFLDIYAMRKPEMVTGLVRRLFRLFLRPLHMIQQLS